MSLIICNLTILDDLIHVSQAYNSLPHRRLLQRGVHFGVVKALQALTELVVHIEREILRRARVLEPWKALYIRTISLYIYTIIYNIYLITWLYMLIPRLYTLIILSYNHIYIYYIVTYSWFRAISTMLLHGIMMNGKDRVLVQEGLKGLLQGQLEVLRRL